MFLTPNRRLAVYLSRRFPSAPALSFNQWVELLWNERQTACSDESIQSVDHASHPSSDHSSPSYDPSSARLLLLTTAEQQNIWESVIAAASQEYPLLSAASTARMAIEAWTVCQQWDIAFDAQDWYQIDHLTFLEWANAYQARLQANAWIDHATLLNWLVSEIKARRLKLPKKLTCLGFQEWTPQQTRFLEACKQAGVSISSQSLLTDIEANPRDQNVFKTSNAVQISCGSTEEELEYSIRFAKNLLADNLKAQIGLVIPELEHRRFEVVRLLETHLSPNQFNVSAPLSLSDYPMIAAALLGLSLLAGENSFNDLSLFLRVPFFGSAFSEMAQRAQLDALLREKPRLEQYSLTYFANLVNSVLAKLPATAKTAAAATATTGATTATTATAAATMATTSAFQIPLFLQDLLQHQTNLREKRTPTEWVLMCEAILNSLQWPGERFLNKQELALKTEWEALLVEYASMGRVLGKQTYYEALREIKRLCRLKKFLPDTSHAPIQVLGLLEALGLPFDALWVMGLHRECWPKEPSPNAFIPLSLQRALDMPRSSAKRELQMASQMTEQLLTGAKNVIFSYPTLIEDRKTSISTLLTQLPKTTVEALGLTTRSVKEPEPITQFTQPFKETANHPRKPYNFTESAPPLKKEEIIRGGSRTLKLQSLCPFRAFAETRLQARPLATEQFGLSPAERGIILHQILLIFWKDLKNQAALKAVYDSNQLNHRIEGSVAKVFKKWNRDPRYLEQPQYFWLEQLRARKLLRQFLELELSRPPFEIIAQEVEHMVILGELPIKLRIDRIDRLESGEDILIDYKTGKTHISDWFGERPRDPQLPLYCIAVKPNPKGVAFALLNPLSCQYQGVADSPGYLPGLQTTSALKRYGAEDNFQQQCESWQQHLEKLAADFTMGHAEVDPVQGEQTCRLCELKSLCRYKTQG